MPQAKRISKRTSRKATVPMLGAAGLSLSLVGVSGATTGGPAADVQTARNPAPAPEITLGEEEISDVTLSTFYVFDKESTGRVQGTELAWGCRGCGGCRGCARACGGCARACGGCVRACGGGCGCCLSWGSCRLC